MAPGRPGNLTLATLRAREPLTRQGDETARARTLGPTEAGAGMAAGARSSVVARTIGPASAITVHSFAAAGPALTRSLAVADSDAARQRTTRSALTRTRTTVVRTAAAARAGNAAAVRAGRSVRDAGADAVVARRLAAVRRGRRRVADRAGTRDDRTAIAVGRRSTALC